MTTGRAPSPVRAAGGVLWRRSPDGAAEVAVVHRPKYDDWSLPKGKLDPGETPVAAAVREVCEETGFAAVVGRALGRTDYRVLDRGRDVPKTVHWWALRATGGDFTPGREVDQLRWLPVAAAARLLTAGREDGVLERFAAAPPDTSTVLLLRHGSAGSRRAWRGTDDDRPLDATGLAQAQGAADVLALYGPQQVLAAPPLRCLQTVQPLSRRLGLHVEPDSALGEASGALGARVRELGGSGRTVVLCSQGGVIPAAVGELLAAAGLDVPVGPAPKGSLWALSFAGGELVAADHTRTLLA